MTSPESTLHVRRDLLDRSVREYADNLREQVYVVWRRFGVKDVQEFDRAVKEKKVAPKDAEEVRDLLRRLRDAVQKNEVTQEMFFGRFVEAETRHLRKFFGQEIYVPPVPESLTPELYEFLKKNRFELHYFPLIGMYEDVEYPGWKYPIRNVLEATTSGGPMSFAQAASEYRVVAGSEALTGQWVMIDARPPPESRDGDTPVVYEHDNVIGGVLKELRARDAIGYAQKGWSNEYSRLNLEYYDLRNEELWKEMSQRFKLPKQAMIRLPRAVEWSYTANAFYPEWFESNTAEWLSEEWFDEGKERFIRALQTSGDPLVRNNVVVKFRDSAYRTTGFRPIIAFY